MVRAEEDADKLRYVGRPPRVLPLGLRWRLLISSYAVFFGSLCFAGSIVICLPLFAGAVWAIWNERMIVLIIPLMIALIFPLLGLASTMAGVRDGLRKIHLLRQGELGQGTILTCRFNKSDRPFPEFLRHWQELQKPNPPPLGVQIAVRFFFLVWNGMLILMMILSVIMAFFALREIALTGTLKIHIGHAHPARMVVMSSWSAVAVILGSLLAWLTLCLLFLSQGRRVRAVQLGQVAPTSPDYHLELRCAFEYRLPRGNVVKAEDSVSFNSQLGDGPMEPVLYDATRPERAILLNGLRPQVRVGPGGTWEAGEGPGTLRRTVLLALCWLGSLPTSYVFWSTITWFQHEN
jgi:hypothetical protein